MLRSETTRMGKCIHTCAGTCKDLGYTVVDLLTSERLLPNTRFCFFDWLRTGESFSWIYEIYASLELIFILTLAMTSASPLSKPRKLRLNYASSYLNRMRMRLGAVELFIHQKPRENKSNRKRSFSNVRSNRRRTNFAGI